jgi:beta-glucosidase-like glycosyl hydrolase
MSSLGLASQVTRGLMMRSYNKINGTWACESESVMNKLLKDELGHRGYIMSDWNGKSFAK